MAFRGGALVGFSGFAGFGGGRFVALAGGGLLAFTGGAFVLLSVFLGFLTSLDFLASLDFPLENMSLQKSGAAMRGRGWGAGGVRFLRSPSPPPSRSQLLTCC